MTDLARLHAAAPDLRAICAELEGVIDEQVYDAMKSFGNDPPDDAEFNVNLTARQIFALTKALNKVGPA